MSRRSRTWRVAVASGLAVLALIGFGILFVATTGIYSVAASSSHFAIVRWFLQFGMTNSVQTHAAFIEAPNLKNEDQIQLGAAHFHSVCAPCHGAPGLRANPANKDMLPSPPALETHVSEWRDRELFWIVKHGIKYTGMPAWPAQHRDDEIWDLVAFLRKLPELNTEDYRTLALGNARRAEQAPNKATEIASQNCARCHDNAASDPPNAKAPRLAGQSREYLSRALSEYARGERASGYMEVVAANLSDDEIEALSEYYANIRPDKKATPAEQLERGRQLATQGAQSQAIPPCISCHGTSAAPTYPRLAGQSAAYILGQLELWKQGLISQTEHGRMMGQIAKRMTPQQMQDAARYFASQGNFQAALDAINPRSTSAGGNP